MPLDEMQMPLDEHAVDQEQRRGDRVLVCPVLASPAVDDDIGPAVAQISATDKCARTTSTVISTRRVDDTLGLPVRLSVRLEAASSGQILALFGSIMWGG